jgi:hypothetical protein
MAGTVWVTPALLPLTTASDAAAKGDDNAREKATKPNGTPKGPGVS